MNDNLAYEDGAASGFPLENTGGLVIEPGDAAADSAENAAVGNAEPVTASDSRNQQDAEEMLMLREQLLHVLSNLENVNTQNKILSKQFDKVSEERDWLIVSALQQMGAVDGRYLLDKMRKDGVTDSEQIFKQAKSRYPQLFRNKLEGVRPAGSTSGEAVAPSEMSFSERMRQFAEDPDGYAQRFR